MTKSEAATRKAENIRPLHLAEARCDSLVCVAESEGPQVVTIDGREAGVVLAANEFHRFSPQRTGRALIDAMRACPVLDFTFGSRSARSPVRGVDL